MDNPSTIGKREQDVNEHEKKTIAAFILPEKRRRYDYLLDNPKKRSAALNRLNHCKDIDPRYIQWLPSNADVGALLKHEGCPDTVYLISSASEIDGKTLPMGEALKIVTEHGWGTMISCIPGKLAYYYDEEGARRAILKR